MNSKLLFRSSAFLCGLALVYLTVVTGLDQLPFGKGVVLSYLTGNFRETGGFGHSLQRFREAETFGKADLVSIGSSYAYRHFDPRIFAAHGIRAFTLGSTGQTPVNSYSVLTDYFDRLRPDLVVLELFPTVVCGDGLESYYDLLANRPASTSMLSMAMNTGGVKAINAMAARYVRRLVQPLAGQSQGDVEGDTYVPGGYVISSNPRGNIDIWSGPYRVSAKQIAYVGKLLDFVRSQESRAVVVIHPVPESTRRTIVNYEELVGVIRALLSEHSDVELIDFNGIVDVQMETDMDDPLHLNQRGVAKFNEALIAIMKERGMYQARGLSPPSS